MDLRLPEINNVELAGNLTRDPDYRKIASGTSVCKLGMAVSKRWKGKDGTKNEDTLFVNVTVWGQSAEYISDNMVKGDPVLVEGSLKMNEWQDKTTQQKRSMIEVVAHRVQPLGWRDKEATPNSSGGEEPMQQNEDIPF